MFIYALWRTLSPQVFTFRVNCKKQNLNTFWQIRMCLDFVFHNLLEMQRPESLEFFIVIDKHASCGSFKTNFKSLRPSEAKIYVWRTGQIHCMRICPVRHIYILASEGHRDLKLILKEPQDACLSITMKNSKPSGLYISSKLRKTKSEHMLICQNAKML